MGKMTRYRKASTYAIHHWHTCIYSPTISYPHTDSSPKITPFDLLIYEAASSQIVLQPSVCYCLPLIDIPSKFVPHWLRCGPWEGLARWRRHGAVCLCVRLVSRGHAAVYLFSGSIDSTNRRGEVMKGEALISGPSSLCVPLLVEMSRPPGPLCWLADKMSGIAPHDLVLLVLWQKTTLEGNSGNHKYLGTKELYGVCCKRIYSSSEAMHQCQRA